ncbi:MAG: MlaD family protein [Planctomycetota bacterium]|nr:MlaD family protein [Planctomycetota bacterium]
MEKWVGAFVFAGLFLLAGLTFLVDDEGRLFAPRGKPYFAVFASASGLSAGDPVWIAGVKKGFVRAVEVEDGAARVEFLLDPSVSLYDGASASIRSGGLIGGNRRLVVEPGDRGKGPLEGRRVAARETAASVEDVMERMSAAMSEIEGAVRENSPNIKATLENLRKLTDRLEKGEGTLGRLISDRELYDSLKSASADLQAGMKGFRTLGESIEKGEGSLGKLVKSPEVHDRAASALANVDEAAKNLRKFSDDLSAGRGTIGRLASDDSLYRKIEKAVDDLSAAASKVSDSKGTLGKLVNDPDVYDNMRKAAENLAEFSERLKRNEGTLGRLLSDDSLYQEAKGFFRESRRAVEDAREQAPISAFASMFFSAVK